MSNNQVGTNLSLTADCVAGHLRGLSALLCRVAESVVKDAELFDADTFWFLSWATDELAKQLDGGPELPKGEEA